MNLRARLKKLENISCSTLKHVIVVAVGKPEWDAEAGTRIEQGRREAEKRCCELEVICLCAPTLQ